MIWELTWRCLLVRPINFRFDNMNTQIQTNEHFVKVMEGHIFVKRWTPKTINFESPIILLHDSLGSVAQWRDFPEILSQKLSRSVIAYDRLGFGQSSPRTELPSVDFISEEASVYFPALKKALEIERYVLLGHSVGGGMALNIAALDEECEGVISMAAQAFVEEITLRGIAEAKAVFDKPEQIARLEKWHGSKASWVLRAWTDRWLSDEFRHWSLEACIAQVVCPVLAIHGEHDEYGSSAFPEYIVTYVSGPAKKCLLKDCGHIPHKERTQEVLQEALYFLQ